MNLNLNLKARYEVTGVSIPDDEGSSAVTYCGPRRFLSGAEIAERALRCHARIVDLQQALENLLTIPPTQDDA